MDLAAVVVMAVICICGECVSVWFELEGNTKRNRNLHNRLTIDATKTQMYS